MKMICRYLSSLGSGDKTLCSNFIFRINFVMSKPKYLLDLWNIDLPSFNFSCVFIICR